MNYSPPKSKINEVFTEKNAIFVRELEDESVI
jgi:hypothetical protein